MKLNSILLFSEDPGKLVDFYKKVFQKDTAWSGGNFHGFNVGGGFLIIGPHDKVTGQNKQPERMIYNLEVSKVEGEFSRIKSLGAKVIAKPYHPGEEKEMTLATFADPDGNYFQLATPMK